MDSLAASEIIAHASRRGAFWKRSALLSDTRSGDKRKPGRNIRCVRHAGRVLPKAVATEDRAHGFGRRPPYAHDR